MKTPLIAATLATAALVLAACGSSSAPSTQSAPPKSPSATGMTSMSGMPSAMTDAGSAPAPTGTGTANTATTITIKNFDYTVSGPATPGAKVSVTNNDDTAHTVTADTGSAFDVTIQPGQTETITAPSKAGTYKFHCTFHAEMHGTLTVAG